MGGADNARFSISQQHGRTISTQDAKSQTGLSGHHAVGLPGALGSVPDDDDVGAVDLIERKEAGRLQVEGTGDERAVRGHAPPVIAGPEAGIERGIRTLAGTARALEESVTHSGTAGEEGVGYHRSKPAGGTHPAGSSAITRKSSPMASAEVNR